MKEYLQELKADESMLCRVCGARGFERCNVMKHAASLASFAALTCREKRITTFQLYGETKP